MRGNYSEGAVREETREHWRRNIVPALAGAETEPLRPFLGDLKGMIALDVGANKGFWSAAFLRSYPNQVSRIYAFDPSPENFRELTNKTDNLMLTPNELELVSPFNVAMGETPGKATLFTNDDGSPLASLYRHEAGGYSHEELNKVRLDKEITVEVETIDRFLPRYRIRQVDIMKVDTEGHEWAVFQGAIGALRHGIIRNVIFEFGMHQVESRRFFKDYWVLFSDLGFRLFKIESGELVPIERYDYKYENFTDNFEIIATSQN